jgi:cysteine desulfurase / selenocysteine lyase
MQLQVRTAPNTKEDLHSFWQKNIQPLFTEESLCFQVKTTDGKQIRYVNLDNGATTAPFAPVKKYVEEMLDCYGSVHRGSGQKSLISTREYDASRELCWG